jgi:hypothetical protein
VEAILVAVVGAVRRPAPTASRSAPAPA